MSRMDAREQVTSNEGVHGGFSTSVSVLRKCCICLPRDHS